MRIFNSFFSWKTLVLSASLTIGMFALAASDTLAQERDQTENTPDTALRSAARVDPSTLGMSIQIPLGGYPGRAGNSIPVVLSYSSKVWGVNYEDTRVNESTGARLYDLLNSAFGQHSVAGWVSSLSIPRIQRTGNEKYSLDGKPGDCGPGTGSPTCYFISRLQAYMPDGSSHELRKDDVARTSLDMTGTFYSVDGSRLKFETSTNTLWMPDGSRYVFNPTVTLGEQTAAQYIDRNGNTISINSSTRQWTDTLNRPFSDPLPVAPAPGGYGNYEYDPNRPAVGDQTYTLPSLGSTTKTYTLRWRRLADVLTPDPTTGQAPALRYRGDYKDTFGNAAMPSPHLFTSSSNMRMAVEEELFNPVVLHEIALPDGSTYKFTYNEYGEINKIVYPTGAYERFLYGKIPSLSVVKFAPYREGNRGVLNRWLSPSGQSADEQPWQYSASLGSSYYLVTITAPDGTRAERYLHRSPDQIYFGFDDARAGSAYEERAYSSSNVMLRRSLTQWMVSGPTPGGHSSATRDPRGTKTVNILLETGASSALAATTINRYEQTSQPLNLTSSTAYGYASVDQATAQTTGIESFNPADALAIRTTETAYLDSVDYNARNIVSLPTSVTIKSGTPVSGVVRARAEMLYDQTSPLSCGASVGWTDPNVSARANITTARQWLDTMGAVTDPNAYVASHKQYDQCGNVRASSDALGNQTQISYVDAFSDNQNRNSYAFPTQTTSAVPDPTGAHGSTTALVQSSVYDFNTGLVTSTADANNKTTTFEYNDSLNRLTKANRPDGGYTITSYNTGAGTNYIRTQTLQQSSPSQQLTDAYSYFDNLGRPVRSYVFDGTTATPWLMTVTDYDSLGRVSRTSNPYRVNTQGAVVSAETLSWTTTTYDDLGRVKIVTAPDGAHVDTEYSASTSGTLGTIVTGTDQALRKRRSLTDALGRLVRVDEPDKDSGVLDDANGPVQSTSYMYDVLGNLRKVDQGGQQRFFMYDSLSRLVRARNPEQNANGQFATSADPVSGNASWSMFYAYDLNGNLTTRIDARDLRADYAYDALNRNYSIAYSGPNISTPNVTRVYDSATNGKGRLATVSSSVSTLTYGAYDSMGRVTSASQTIGGRTFSLAYTYDYAGQVKSMTYPSGHVVNYAFDVAGRINNFTGNLGDGVTRTYSTAVSYSEFGGIKEEQFGTATPLYHKQRYNLRGQLWDMRLSTVSAATDAANGDRGAIVNYYSNSYTQGASGTDNNGNLLRQENYIPGSSYFQDSFDYDYLNRLKSVTEKLNGTGTDSFKQAYTYDRWGNRLINQTTTTANVPHPNFTVDTGTNRLNAPSGYTFGYDASGNQYSDNYGDGSGGVSYARTYDHENRMTTSTATYANPPQVLTSTYTYDADGRRIKRNVNGTETWQVYGVGGELLAEYVPGAATFLPTKEYGYRGGELLVTMSSGDDLRLLKFLHKMYDGALGRAPNSTEQQQGMDSLSAAGAQGQAQLLAAAQAIAQGLFDSSEYDARHRSDADFVNDLYWTYPQRAADAGGYQAWLNAIPTSGRSGVRDGFAGSSEFAGLVSRIYGVAASDDLRTILFVYKLYSALNRDPSSSELQAGIDRLNAKAIIGQTDVIAEAQAFAREKIFNSDEYASRHRTNREFVQDLYLSILQRAPDTAGWDGWTNAVPTSGPASVLEVFLNGSEFQYLAGTLYREEFWLVSDHLGTPRMVVDKSGSLAGIKRHDYLPFGEELSAEIGGRIKALGYSASDGVRQKFTQYERDNETGLDFAEARYYSNTQGRFTRPDPYNIVFEMKAGRNARERAQILGAYISEPQNWNRYTYCLNNPTNFYDPSGLIWVRDTKDDLYIFVKDEDYQTGNQYYDDQDRYQAVTEGPNGVTFTLTKLFGSYNTPENQALLGQQVYLGADGNFVPVNRDTTEVPVDPFTNMVLQAGGSGGSPISLGGGVSYVPSTGYVYVTPSGGTPGRGVYAGVGTTTNLDQSAWGETWMAFHVIGGGVTVYPGGDTTNLVGLGLGYGGSLGYSYPVCRLPPAIYNVRVHTIDPAVGMPLGDGLYTVDWEKVHGGP